MSVNKVILLGNLGDDPKITEFEGDDKCVARLSVATNESYKNAAGEKVNNTEWHIVVVWNKLAKTIEKHFKKGNQIYLEGKKTTRSYEDKEGVKRYVTEIVMRSFSFVGKSDNVGGSGAGVPPSPEATDAPPDDLPF